MRPDAALPVRGAALLLALTAALLLLRQGQVPLVGPDEPRYARVAVEMSRSGDFVTRALQGLVRLLSPPWATLWSVFIASIVRSIEALRPSTRRKAAVSSPDRRTDPVPSTTGC